MDVVFDAGLHDRGWIQKGRSRNSLVQFGVYDVVFMFDHKLRKPLFLKVCHVVLRT